MQNHATVEGGSMGRDMDIFIEPHGEDEPAVLAIIAFQVGAAAAQGHAQRGAGRDHASWPEP